MQRITPRLTQDAGDARTTARAKDHEKVLLEMTDRNAVPEPLEAQASASSPKTPGNEISAAGLPFQMPHEASGRPADMNASLDILAEQMLTLVEVVSAQEKDIKTLKARCQQLEEHDQAIMVAFTTFFHVLAAGHVAKLEDITAILHNIIKVAQREAYPQESVNFLQGLATMLHERSGAGAAEMKVHDPLESENDAA
jgi:hypothetical protein